MSEHPKSQRTRLTVWQYVTLVGKERAKVALYVNNFVCRQTRAEWPYGLVSENSSREIVIGATGSTESQVVRRELLVAMKVHSGRNQDLRDIVMLSERVDWEAVARFAARGSKEKVDEQVESAIARIGEDRLESALKAEFGLRADARLLIKRTIRGLQKTRTLLRKQEANSRL